MQSKTDTFLNKIISFRSMVMMASTQYSSDDKILYFSFVERYAAKKKLQIKQPEI